MSVSVSPLPSDRFNKQSTSFTGPRQDLKSSTRAAHGGCSALLFKSHRHVLLLLFMLHKIYLQEPLTPWTNNSTGMSTPLNTSELASTHRQRLNSDCAAATCPPRQQTNHGLLSSPANNSTDTAGNRIPSTTARPPVMEVADRALAAACPLAPEEVAVPTTAMAAVDTTMTTTDVRINHLSRPGS
jgi:hypothetical protein